LKIFKRLIYQTNLKYPKNQSFKTRPGGRPGPRPGFRVLAGSPGLTGSILFKKNQNDVVLVKKKQKSTGLSPGLDRVTGSTRRVSRVTPGFSFPRFFINPARFRPQVGPPGRAGFQNYAKMYFSLTNFCQVNGLKYFKDLAQPRGLDSLAETKTNTN